MKRRIIGGVGLSVVILAVVVAFLLMRIVGGEASGTVTAGGEQVVKAAQKAETDKNYDGKYVSFTYPASYRMGNGITDERLELTGSTGKSKVLAMTVGKGAIENDPGYNMRHQKQLYRQSALGVAGLEGTLFTGTGKDFEQVAYITNGARWLSIAVSDPNTVDWSADINQVLTTFRWK